MSSAHYKTLLSHLPGMAAVVNAFESSEVQLEVYNTLIQALDGRMAESGIAKKESKSNSSEKTSTDKTASDDELAHDLVEGASIHADLIAD